MEQNSSILEEGEINQTIQKTQNETQLSSNNPSQLTQTIQKIQKETIPHEEFQNQSFQKQDLQSLQNELCQNHSQEQFYQNTSVDHQKDQQNQFCQNIPAYYQANRTHFQAEQKIQNNIKKKPFIDDQNCLYRFQSMEKAIRKIYYRTFHNRLITFYIQSLKQQQRKIRQTKQIEIKILKQQNWPFKELFYKKNKNQNQQIMLQFINMCAQKIQATFKSYITFKRHNLAVKKLKVFKQKLGAVALGWKVWNIYNCKKIVQLRRDSKNVIQQIEKQINDRSLEKQKKVKKIQYLYQNQSVIKQNFHRIFHRFYNSGTWIYEVDKCFKMSFSKQNQNNFIQNSNNRAKHGFNKKVNAHNTKDSLDEMKNPNQFEQDNPKPKRKRQFKISRNQIKPKQETKVKSNAYDQQQSGNFNQFGSIKSVNSTNYQNSQLQERPIVAKGKYQIDQQNIKNSENQFLKFNQSNKLQINENNLKEEDLQRKSNNLKLDQKKKLVKKQKYDPRKAIQQQKKRIEEQRKIKQQRMKLQMQNPKQNTKDHQEKQKLNKSKTPNKIKNKTPLKNKKQQKKRQVQSPQQSSKQKTVQKIKKQSKLVKKDDNSKSIKSIVLNKKVVSKIDCWGQKKQSTNLINQQASYKSKYLMSLKQKTQIKQVQKQPDTTDYTQGQRKNYQIEIASKKHGKYAQNSQKQILQKQQEQQRIQKQPQQTYKSNYLKRLTQQREKGSFSYVNSKLMLKKNTSDNTNLHKQHIASKTIQDLNNNIKRLSQNRSSLSNLKNMSQERKIILHQNSQTHFTKKKQQVYRPVESLQDVYSSQYTDRMNNLKNKLNMLQSTRLIQINESIPILIEDSKFVKKMYKDHAFSSLYWPQVRTMETNFLDYIKFSFTGA